MKARWFLPAALVATALAVLVARSLSHRGAAAGSPVGAGASLSRPPGQHTRVPVVAGPEGRGFYPSDAAALSEALDRAFAHATTPRLQGRLLGLVVPHAGYEYSATVAASAYTCIREAPPETVVLLGPSHHVAITGGAIADYASWRTPLGEVRVDLALARDLCNSEPLFRMDSAPHADEHCIEVQLPFIQRVASEARIVPVAIGDEAGASGTAQRLADALTTVLRGRNAVLVASSDLSHYPEASECERVDRAMLEAITSLDPDQLLAEDSRQLGRDVRGLECTLCGLTAVEVAIRTVRGLGAGRSQVLAYANSGQVVPATRHRSVGYGAVAFLSEGTVEGDIPARLTAAQRARLVAAAREAIRAHLRGERIQAGRSTDPALMRPAAVFVTLTKSGQLRGCIGCTEPELPLIDAVARYAQLAAFGDHRFEPVREAELPELSIEISVLSPLVRVPSPDDIVLGRHGVMVTQSGRRGLFLPQVATEHHMGRDEFLTRLCSEKAGLPGDAWKRGAELYVFTVEHFSEEEHGTSL